MDFYLKGLSSDNPNGLFDGMHLGAEWSLVVLCCCGRIDFYGTGILYEEKRSKKPSQIVVNTTFDSLFYLPFFYSLLNFVMVY